MHTDINMAAARTVTARARAMETAAGNEAGAMRPASSAWASPSRPGAAPA